MATEIFFVNNIKCMGCVKTIVEGLNTVEGITNVQVEKEEGKVSLELKGIERNIITEKLNELGYPEKKKSIFSFFK
jgi:copper chaperone CopZ